MKMNIELSILESITGQAYPGAKGKDINSTIKSHQFLSWWL
jgi:hypothetical protein